jgi:cobalt-zinc-cadmium efflux system protein
MSHQHARRSVDHRRRLGLVLAITCTILAVEVAGALLSGSLVLLADAGHMATDAGGIGLSLLAMWFAARPSGPSRTFGFHRLEILAAVANALVLCGVGVYILVETVLRLLEPPVVASGTMLVFGAVGLAGNAVSLGLLRHGQAQSLNLRGAFLEVLNDLLGSAAVLVAGVVIWFTGFQRADAIASAVVGLLILPRTWKLLREALDVLLEAAPKGVDLAEVRRHLLDDQGVVDVHDLHAWTITSGMPVLSAHIVVDDPASSGQVLDRLRDCLRGHFDIDHSTIQVEPAGHQHHEGSTHP